MKDVVLLWISFAILLGLVLTYLLGHVRVLTHPHEKSYLAILTTILLLATISAAFLLPILDVSLVSSTNIPILGVRKEAATDSKVDSIVRWIKIAYIGVYTLLTFLSVSPLHQ